MASGCPCIVADTGGLREVVPGDVGLRFRSRDAAALAQDIERVLTDEVLRDRLVAEGRESGVDPEQALRDAVRRVSS